MDQKNSFLQKSLLDLEQNGHRRRMRLVEGPQGREIVLEGRKVLNFCSNDYLGLAADVRLRQAAVAGMKTQGFGAGASRLVCGNMAAHHQLEEKLARFKGTESAISFSSGYMANVGILSSLFGRDDVIFSDRLNHASIVDGILLSQAKLRRFAHRDLTALEEMLKSAPARGKKLIVTDSVFSMDGDLAPLSEIVALAKKYDCWTMVDEAHGLGVFGREGKGAVEHFGLEGKIDIQMGTFSKAVGSFGAYACGSKDLVDFFINEARSLIYTTGLPPSVAAASLKGIEIIESEPERRKQLWDNTRYVLSALQEMGFDTLVTESPIIPIVVKDADLAVRFSRELLEKGIFVSAIRPPTVPQGTSRLRLTVTAAHTRRDIDGLLQQLEIIGRRLCILSKPQVV